MTTYGLLSISILALMLYLPASRLVWVLSVRQIERKLQRKLNAEEVNGQYRRAKIISLPVVLVFSLLFNLQLHRLMNG